MAKYDPLFEHLCRAPDGPLEVTFEEIDTLVRGLPPSARRLRAWWTNEVGGRHVQARAWLNAGREVVAVDVPAGKVTFGPARWTRGS